MYNDLGFMIDKRLIILVEAQSTWTANIILRALMYLAQTYHDYIAKEELNVYSSKALDLPEPEMYVIYTGNKKIAKESITLSEEFFGGKRPILRSPFTFSPMERKTTSSINMWRSRRFLTTKYRHTEEQKKRSWKRLRFAKTEIC